MKSMKCKYLFGLAVIAGAMALAMGLPGSASEDPAGLSLLGCTSAEAIERLGVPDSIQCSAHDLAFCYASEGGEAMPLVRIHEDCVYWVKPGTGPVAAPKPPPASGVYPGQPLQEMLERAGQPAKILCGDKSLILEYETGMEVSIGCGMVLHVTANS